MLRYSRLSFLMLAILLISCAEEAAPPTLADSIPQPGEVVFVCEHGSVKSLMSSTIFNQLAEARGLNYKAVSRGLTPDENVPPKIVEAFRSKGVDVSSYEPRLLSSSEFAEASRIISIGVDLSAFGEDGPVEEWFDVPPASLDFDASHEDMRRRIMVLLNELDSSEK